MTLGRLALIFVLLAAGIQLIRPARTNPPEDASHTLATKLAPPAAVAGTLERSCKDCHSNRTEWPWYSGVAPVSWFVIHDVNEGRGKVNFSEWAGYSADDAHTKLNLMCEEVTRHDMPVFGYTAMHAGSALTEADIKALCDWTKQAEQQVQH